MEKKNILKFVKTPESSFQLDSDDSQILRRGGKDEIKKKDENKKYFRPDYEMSDSEKESENMNEKKSNEISEEEKNESGKNIVKKKELKNLEYENLNYANHYSDSFQNNSVKMNDDLENDIFYEKSIYLKNDENRANWFKKLIFRENFSKKLIITILLSILFFLIIKNLSLSNKKDDLIEKLINLEYEIENIKKIKPKKIIDIGRIEKGTQILSFPEPYKYGLIWKKTGGNILNIFSENYDSPYAMSGDTGKIIFLFQKSVRIKKIGIIYPPKKSVENALKKFSVNDETFEYENVGFYQEFLFKNVKKIDDLKMEILSNHGNKKFTCIYKIYIWIEE